ncbi:MULTISPECIES: response regulator [unclassified Legionella]|uniref:response regulator n=1 Tax=unclassified Legionella TaxID=2622702 RepID=UPI001E65C627|nr:response regulator [Legionella sp. 31fI33]
MPGKASILEIPKNKISCTTLLLVEDNSIALQMIGGYREKPGCHYTSATDGEDALEIAKSKDFDLIITDIGLPALSVNELTRQIRAQLLPDQSVISCANKANKQVLAVDTLDTEKNYLISILYSRLKRSFKLSSCKYDLKKLEI